MKRLKQLLLVLCAAQLMVILDITAVNVALPDMAQGLGIDGGDIGWTITSYSLIFGSLLLLGGRAADLIGPRRMFMTGLGLFTCASIAAATEARVKRPSPVMNMRRGPTRSAARPPSRSRLPKISE